MYRTESSTFQSLTQKLGQFDLSGKKFLIPEMNRIGCHLMAGVFQGFGIDAAVMPTFQSLKQGKEATSGKECFPCQVTLSDLFNYLDAEKQRLGGAFDPERYVYFMPEATGPCRFGMYNKFQRIVLDSIPEYKDVKIGSLTTENSYSLEGMVDPSQTRQFRKKAYLSVIVGDILDRLLWRIRPYECDRGAADGWMEQAMEDMCRFFVETGAEFPLESLKSRIEKIVEDGTSLMDRQMERKPRVGIVGEIYLRSHTHSNQDLVRLLERCGAEVVVASISEWMDFTAYDHVRRSHNACVLEMKTGHFREALAQLKKNIIYRMTLNYQQKMQDELYAGVNRSMDLEKPHRVGDLEAYFSKNDTYTFEVGTEASLSIAGLLAYVKDGYDGVVNVYPFTCMPGTITASVAKPLMSQSDMPCLDVAYDETIQPGREATIETFMYQVKKRQARQSSNQDSA
ncbi:MAG: CoA activase [Desulfohalobiaceae bacterium]|nr:CoA activase [Desulfohalobiaceae bacterium]